MKLDLNAFVHQLKWKNEVLDGYFMNMNGEVFSHRSNKILSPFFNKEGRYMISLLYDGGKKALRLDYLVAFTFLGYHDDCFRLIHLNGNENDYSIINLRWLRISDIMKEYEEKFGVSNVLEIDEVWTLYSSTIRGKSIDISNFGNIRDHDTLDPIIPKESHGYLCFFENKKVWHVHRMVGELYVDNPNPEEFNMINHIDGNKMNNAFYNLEWCNISMNTDHGHMTGRVIKHDESTVRYICEQLALGIPHTEIAEKIGVSRKYISKIATGKIHKKIANEYTFKKPISLYDKFNRPLLEILIRNKKTPKEIVGLLKIEYSNSFIKFYERVKRELNC